MISVIIPTYKRSKNLTKAIESILSQNGDFEIIVVDDNDSESEYRKENEKLLKKYENISNFYYLKHKKNKNGAAARNTGIDFAHGEYVTFLDDDDEFVKGRIEKIEKCISEKKPNFICTGVIIKRNGLIEKRIIPLIDVEIKKIQNDLLYQKSFFATGSNIVCKLELVKKINGFDTTFIRHQDVEFVIRYLDMCKKIECISEYLVIKNCDDNLNVPPFSKMLKVKEKFLNKFSYLINKLPIDEQKAIINKNYYELLGNAYYRGEKENLQECKNYLKKMGIYSIQKDIKINLKHRIKRLKIIKKIRSWINK